MDERCNIWQEISSDDPGLSGSCGTTGSYLLITVDADDGITSSQIATALSYNSFEGLLCQSLSVAKTFARYGDHLGPSGPNLVS